MKVAYERGLHELGDGLWCWLQPDGGWGWSNAGLVTADGTSLLVDTLFDLKCAREMLEAMRPLTERNPIEAAMNTHGNGDHCFGNQLLPGDAAIYATRAAAEEMQAAPPQLLHALSQTDLGKMFFGAFDFEGIELRLPSETFEGALDIRVGDRDVQFMELGPAHTGGDAIAYVPDSNVVFTGDLLFIEGTPIMWAGPVSNWLAACDRILEFGARVLVPGHGPVTDDSGVRDVQRYLTHVRDEARKRFDAGMEAVEASDDIDITDFADWGDAERIAVNVETLYCEFDPAREKPSAAELFARMAEWRMRHSH
jgi:glyoxylase-like metal-dependent hydrolase (beta-lactamase superfamily II)